jgi:hypothetical protein
VSIQELIGKIKATLDRRVGEWGIPVIVILVGLASFGLGRLSALEGAKPVVSVGNASAAAAPAIAVGGLIVASRTGSSYHYPWCAGADTIKEGNKVWFKDEAAAQKAGYKPAQNCRGLK